MYSGSNKQDTPTSLAKQLLQTNEQNDEQTVREALAVEPLVSEGGTQQTAKRKIKRIGSFRSEMGVALNEFSIAEIYHY